MERVAAERPASVESLRRAGGACMVGASILAIGGFGTQVAQASTTVSDEAWSYPWTSETVRAISSLWAVAQILVVVGLVGLRRSGVAGRSVAARVGLALALTGTSLILVGHLASIPISDRAVDDTAPSIVGAVFGLGTFLSAIGLTLAGTATLQARVWRDWRRFTPLVTGIWTFALIGLQLTQALPTAVGIYALCFLAVGVALRTRPSPAVTEPAFAPVQAA